MDIRPLVLDLALSWERLRWIPQSHEAYELECKLIESSIEQLSKAVLLGKEPSGD